MKCSLGTSNFLEEITSLSHSIVFLSFFALITEESFLISPCYSLEPCIQMGTSFFFSFAFCFSSFLSYVIRPPQTSTSPSCISFLGDDFSLFLLYNVMKLCASSDILSTRSNPLNLFITSTCNKGFRSYVNGLVVFPTFFNLGLNLAISAS